MAIGAGKAAGHVRRETVGGDDVEADRGHHHDAAPPRLGVTGGEGFDDRDLARDVEVMRACAQAGVDHRTRGGGERPRGMDDDADVAQRAVQLAGMLQPRRAQAWRRRSTSPRMVNARRAARAA